MKCVYCGAILPEEAILCSNCWQPANASADASPPDYGAYAPPPAPDYRVYTPPAYAPYAPSPYYSYSPYTPYYAEQHRKAANSSMVCGIIGLALSWLGVFSLGIVSAATLALSIFAVKRAKKNRIFAESVSIPESSQNRTGTICGIIGLIFSAGILCLMILVFALMLIILLPAPYLEKSFL